MEKLRLLFFQCIYALVTGSRERTVLKPLLLEQTTRRQQQKNNQLPIRAISKPIEARFFFLKERSNRLLESVEQSLRGTVNV